MAKPKSFESFIKEKEGLPKSWSVHQVEDYLMEVCRDMAREEELEEGETNEQRANQHFQNYLDMWGDYLKEKGYFTDSTGAIMKLQKCDECERLRKTVYHGKRVEGYGKGRKKYLSICPECLMLLSYRDEEGGVKKLYATPSDGNLYLMEE